MRYHINIGTNQGNRRTITDRAVALISLLSDRGPAVSSPFFSEPQGFDSDSEFMNTGIEIESELSPDEMLAALRSIEIRLGATPHRNPDGTYRDRNIDLDLICVTSEDVILQTPSLILPHPRMCGRDFVLYPLKELSPGWRHPVSKKTIEELIANEQL